MKTSYVILFLHEILFCSKKLKLVLKKNPNGKTDKSNLSNAILNIWLFLLFRGLFI